MVNRHRKEQVTIEVTGRLDSAVASSSSIPRSVFSLPSVSILLNGKSVKKSAKVKDGDIVELEWDEEFFRKISEEEEREEEAFQVILMNEEEMLSFGNALEEYYSKEEEEESL